jgi:MFS family permease
VIDKWGKKIGYILLAFPQIGFWACVLFGNTVVYLYVARFLLGITQGGMYIIMPLFVADVSEKEVRGTMGCLYTLVVNVGYLIGYVMASYIEYFTMAWIMLPTPLIFVFFMLFIPDTPYCLLQKEKMAKAEKSLMFYRGIKDPQNGGFRKELEGLVKMVSEELTWRETNKLSVSDFTEKKARRGLAISLFLMVLSEASGFFAVLQYTATIFEESGSNFTPNESTIIVASLQILGILVSFFIVDKCGRKVLLLISTVGMGLGMTGIAVYSYLDSTGVNVAEFNWLPVVSLSFAIFIVNIGLVGIPFFIIPEILPKKILSIGNLICMEVYNIAALVVLKITPVMIEDIKIYGTMGTFAIICFAGSVVMLIFLPETKGKDLTLLNVESNTVDEEKKNKDNVS